jgi:hypothetical protein
MSGFGDRDRRGDDGRPNASSRPIRAAGTNPMHEIAELVLERDLKEAG